MLHPTSPWHDDNQTIAATEALSAHTLLLLLVSGQGFLLGECTEIERTLDRPLRV
jgi:hypothetical protein